MTTVITRYFDDAAQARLVRRELITQKRFSPRILDLYESSAGLADHLSAAYVDPKTARAYQERVSTGGAVLLVRAGYRPLAVAQTTREMTAAFGAADLGGLIEEVFVKDPPSRKLSILDAHPNFLTRPRDPEKSNYHMADWPIPLISRRKPFRDMLFEPHARMANFPIPLISKRKPYTEMLIDPHGRMADFPIPLLSDRKPYTESIVPAHGRMANFPIPLISRRKPFNGSVFPRHARMANWPFPHLINKRYKTTLMPGAPRMANFPIPLLSNRKPFTGSAFSRHARMANFPIPLKSGRKPYTGSMIEPHGRMANFPLPLVTRGKDGSGFTLSKLFGIPTVIRR